MASRQTQDLSASPRRGDALFFALLAAVLGLALFLRAWNLDGPSLWEDELLTLDRASMDLGHMFQVQKFQGPADTIFDLQPPLIYAALHGVLAISDTSLAARSLSAAAGCLTVFGFFLLGSRTAGRRTGLLAALLCAVSLYHVEASRSIKHYALFICLGLYSLYFCLGYVRTRVNRDLAAFAACSAGMLYCGYQGVGLLAAMAAASVWALRRGRHAPASVGRPVFRLCLVLALVGAAYLPYVQAPFFLRDFLHNPGVDPVKTLTPGFFLGILNGFVSHIYAPTAWQTALVAAWCAIGALGFARERDKTAAVLLASWSVLPSAILLASRSDIQPILTSRHFAFLFIPGVLCAARGLDASAVWLASLAFPEETGRRVSLGLGLAACLGLAVMNLDSYVQQMDRDIGMSRDLFHWITREGREARSLRYLGYKRNTMRFAERWYLPGRYLPAGDWDTPGYRREFLVMNSLDAPGAAERSLPGVPVERYGNGTIRTSVTQAGFVNRAPLVMAPGPDGRYAYADDFRGFAFLEDCFRSANFSPDVELGLLRPDGYSRPASALYVFQVPPGARAADVRAGVTAQAYKRHPTIPFDSVLEVLASPDGREFTSMGVIGQESFSAAQGGGVRENCGFFEEIDFYRSCLTVKKDWDVSRFVGSDGQLFLKIMYTPGVAEGFLNVAGFGLSARLDAPGGADAGQAALAGQAANLARNIRAVPWNPGEVPGGGVYAFASRDAAWLAGNVPGLSPAGALGPFLAEHPGIVPVYTLRDAQGRDAVTVYDPQLGTAGMRLSRATPERTIRLPQGETLKAAGLVLGGKLRGPVIEVGGRRIEVPVIAPEGSVLTINAGGEGRLTFSPDFATGFDARDTFDEENLARTNHPDYQGGVTCKPGTRCHFTYLIVSAYPIEALRMRTYPRLYGQPGDPGRSVVSYSADGSGFLPLDEQTAALPEDWTPMHTQRTVSVRFDTPVRKLLLRFDLQANDNAEFWSHTRPTDAMWIEADLAKVWLEPFQAGGPEVAVKLVDPADNDLSLRISGQPLVVRDAGRTNYFAQ
ncbi:MAG: glycosyltransferase family 39 protein [Acidobacteriota bacterium]